MILIAEAVHNELDRRRRPELWQSLDNPHPESLTIAEEGFTEWADSLPKEDTNSLFDPASMTPVTWIPGKGWVVGDK